MAFAGMAGGGVEITAPLTKLISYPRILSSFQDTRGRASLASSGWSQNLRSHAHDAAQPGLQCSMRSHHDRNSSVLQDCLGNDISVGMDTNMGQRVQGVVALRESMSHVL